VAKRIIFVAAGALLVKILTSQLGYGIGIAISAAVAGLLWMLAYQRRS
jgi:hypothetical protein